MDTAAPFRLVQVLSSRCNVIANDWYRAIAPTACVSLSATQVRQCLAELTEQIITLMLGDPLDRNAARGIGVALARLRYTQPESLAATLKVLAQQLIAELPAEQATLLYPRLTTLLSELAAGFSAQAIETLLAEQEPIRWQPDEKLYEAEARYRTLVERIPAITYIAALDEASTTLYVSPQVESILGFSPSEYQADADIWRERLHPDDRERTLAEVARSHATGEPLVSDYRMLARDGRVVWFHDEAALVHDAAGQPLFLQGVMLDITRHKQAEEQLDRLSTAIKVASDAICMTDSSGALNYQNQAFSDLFEYGVDELNAAGGLAKTFCKPNAARQVFDTLMGGQSWTGEVEMCTRRGRAVSISLRADAVRDPSGRVMTLICIMTNITEQKQMEELLVRHAQEMAALYKTSLEISAQLDVATLLQAIVQRATKLVGTHMGGLYLMRPDGQTLELLVSHNLPGDYLGVILHLGEGLAGRVAQTGKPITVDDYLHWEGRASAYATAPFSRVLGVPLKVRDNVIGVISINDDTRTGPFSEDEIRLVSLFADQAAIAIENARLYHAEREQRELAEMLREIGAMLVSTLDITTVLDRILESVCRIVPNDAANIMLVKDGAAHFAGWRGFEQFGNADLTNFIFSVAGTHNLQHMVETGEPMVIPDQHTDPHWMAVPGTERLRSYAGAPIRVRGETIGFLSVHSVIPGRFEWTDAERLRLFASQAAIALENARLFEEARTTNERLQVLSQRMVEVQEAERRLIARELHDEIGQTLTAVKINLQALQRSANVAENRAILEESVSVVERALQQVRNLSLDLRPSLLDDLGLVPALRWYVDRQAQRAGFTVVFTADSLEARLSPELEIACFRLAQEALTNVARHARAKRVLVELHKRDTELELTIRDDGVGFDVQSALERALHGASLGLLGMNERVSLVGGQMRIESVPMQGTEIHARFPLALPSSRAQGLAAR